VTTTTYGWGLSRAIRDVSIGRNRDSPPVPTPLALLRDEEAVASNPATQQSEIPVSVSRNRLPFSLHPAD
jgi:hypothetical protein